MGISQPCSQCITLILWMKCNLLRVWKLSLFLLCTPNWSDTEYIPSCGTMYPGAHIQTFQRNLPPPSSGWCRLQVPSRRCYISTSNSGWTRVTVSIVVTTLRTSDLILYDAEQVLEILAKIWLTSECKFRYLIVVCVNSLIVRCLWTSQEVCLSAYGRDLIFWQQWQLRSQLLECDTM
jgi:hypothetical protein